MVGNRGAASITATEYIHAGSPSPEPTPRIFAAIASKTKHIEYRKQSPYWRKRLKGREYDVILFRNGYAKDAPEMQVEFRGLRRYGKGHAAYYAIRLGRILKIKRWPERRQ